MTNREATDVLKVIKAVYEDKQSKGEAEALQMAMDALNKQIPVMPVKSKTARYGMGWDYHDWECPTCGAFLAPEPTTNGDHHCKCGQAIDWKSLK